MHWIIISNQLNQPFFLGSGHRVVVLWFRKCWIVPWSVTILKWCPRKSIAVLHRQQQSSPCHILREPCVCVLSSYWERQLVSFLWEQCPNTYTREVNFLLKSGRAPWISCKFSGVGIGALLESINSWCRALLSLRNTYDNKYVPWEHKFLFSFSVPFETVLRPPIC